MDSDRIHVPYRTNLKPLEGLLAKVSRPGGFFVQGSLEIPLPRVEIEGVGVLSFPVMPVQAHALIQQAERAPYGRGGETLLDTSVRKVWQIAPAKVRLGGKSWDGSFKAILETVTTELGCEKVPVSAELYKLLIYDEGAFFQAHRDTEKADGMFGTLVVVLPSAHSGGELIIRHAGREVTVDLRTPEVSELKFAAFYADCEHEVRPVTEGNRVCLIYNLIQSGKGKASSRPLTAPLYDAETQTAAELLTETFQSEDAPAKLAWLLEHQYSPAGLTWAGLKGRDAALAKVLGPAAATAGCAVHLGIVHIEESGPAEPDYDSYGYGRSRGRYDDEETEEDVSSGEFTVVEVSESSRYVDQWVDPQDRPVDFGKLPLVDGEVLPAGALDGEAPDEQRLTEATGNEGASFERSYHRAALILWPRDRFADVVLQAGVGAGLPYLKDQIEAVRGLSANSAQRQSVQSIARRMIEQWKAMPPYPSYSSLEKSPDRGEMIRLLGRLGDAPLLTRFLSEVVTHRFDGGENQALALHTGGLETATAGELLAGIVRENIRRNPVACVDLLNRLVEGRPSGLGVSRRVAAAVVEGLPSVEPPRAPYADPEWWRTKDAKPVSAAMVAELLASLAVLGDPKLGETAAQAIAASAVVFDSGNVIAPAFELLREQRGFSVHQVPGFLKLWHHATGDLLARSEYPPAPPTDWRQAASLSCKCEDCRELQTFLLNPGLQVHRFRARQDRRNHLSSTIRNHGLDVTEITDRKGSPQTLVCTKNRRSFERRCDQYRKDIKNLTLLAKLVEGGPVECAATSQRIAEANARKRTAQLL